MPYPLEEGQLYLRSQVRITYFNLCGILRGTLIDESRIPTHYLSVGSRRTALENLSPALSCSYNNGSLEASG